MKTLRFWTICGENRRHLKLSPCAVKIKMGIFFSKFYKLINSTINTAINSEKYFFAALLLNNNDSVHCKCEDKTGSKHEKEVGGGACKRVFSSLTNGM